MAQKNRELSQFSSFLEIDNSNQNIGIATTTLPYVGIGTTNPTSKLHVVGDTNVSGIISATGYYLNGTPLVSAGLELWEVNGSNTYRSTGNVGIGSSIPESKLTVVGNISATGAITATGSITGSSVSISGNVSAGQFISTITSGTAPLVVSSTSQVFNLNASLLAGKSPPSGDIVGTTDIQSLTNKTLTSPTISSILNDGTLTLPTGTGTLIRTGSVGLVTSGMITGLSLTNVDIASNAGIVYSKLNLSNSITAADIVVGAGITYGKLSLSNSITNTDIATGAGISVSKLSANTISGITLGNNLATLTFGTYLTGASYNGSTATTLGINASTSGDSNIVARDGSGNFSAGDINVNNLTATNGNFTGIVTTGNLTATGIVSDSYGNLRDIPQNSKTASYILANSDNGKHISITTGGVTVPASVFDIGDVVTIFNNSGSSQTITQGSGVTLRFAGSSSTGNRTLSQYGVCTILTIVGGATPTIVICGAGLT